MQDSPPDILMTNYSMLNIMLMRDIDAPVFDRTCAWLQADPNNVFHLIVDELHTYRGTAGTEVAYLLRALFDRLGLSPDSEQLRIIASSASLDADQTGLTYLEGFFGRNRQRFRLLAGSTKTPDPNAPNIVRTYSNALKDLQVSVTDEETITASAAKKFANQVGVVNETTNAEQLLAEAFEQIQAPDALRLACTSDERPLKPVPKTPNEIARRLFVTLSDADAEQATALLWAACTIVRA